MSFDHFTLVPAAHPCQLLGHGQMNEWRVGNRKLYYIGMMERPSESENYVKGPKHWTSKKKKKWKAIVIYWFNSNWNFYKAVSPRAVLPTPENIDFHALLYFISTIHCSGVTSQPRTKSHTSSRNHCPRHLCLCGREKHLQKELHNNNNNLGNYTSKSPSYSSVLFWYSFIFLQRAGVSWVLERSQLLPE